MPAIQLQMKVGEVVWIGGECYLLDDSSVYAIRKGLALLQRVPTKNILIHLSFKNKPGGALVPLPQIMQALSNR